MVRRIPDKNLWYNKGFARKRQIYNWFDDVVRLNGLFFYFKDIFNFIVNGEFQKSYERFTELVKYIVINRPSNGNGDILGYLIDENIKVFGTNTIITDLFNGIVKPKTRARGLKSQKIPVRVKTKSIQELEKEYKTKKTERYYLGLTKSGKRKRGNLEIYISKYNKTIYILRDKKTGRFLKQSKTLKKEIKKRQ